MEPNEPNKREDEIANTVIEKIIHIAESVPANHHSLRIANLGAVRNLVAQVLASYRAELRPTAGDREAAEKLVADLDLLPYADDLEEFHKQYEVDVSKIADALSAARGDERASFRTGEQLHDGIVLGQLQERKKWQGAIAEFLSKATCPDCDGAGYIGYASNGLKIACEKCGGDEDALGSGYYGLSSDMEEALNILLLTPVLKGVKE